MRLVLDDQPMTVSEPDDAPVGPRGSAEQSLVSGALPRSECGSGRGGFCPLDSFFALVHSSAAWWVDRRGLPDQLEC